jgi:catechol 2,3-dioxygenase-like lactoylglutathione lyase family enzyme
MKQFIKFILITIAVSLFHYALLAQTRSVDAICITVSNMDRSVKFYSEVLGFKKLSDEQVHGAEYEKLQGLFGLNIRIVRMQLGDEFIELIDYLTAGGRSIPEDFRSNDLSFQHIAIVVSDMDAAYRHLREYNVVHVSTLPQTLPVSNVAAAGIKAFYFQDPDKHNLELIYFPKGKGQQKWQSANGKLFLGIDHTAIAVSNTDKSLWFYQALLGIERKGDSWNEGVEQQHLNNVEGASLHITGLRAAAGPGIEFLEYLQPGPGKPYPIDSRTDDLWHWQTILMVGDAKAVYNKLKSSNISFISKEIVMLAHKGKRSQAFLVRDPDGHAMLIMEYAGNRNGLAVN